MTIIMLNILNYACILVSVKYTAKQLLASFKHTVLEKGM